MKYKNTKRGKRIEKILGSGDGMCGVERGESGLQIPRNSTSTHMRLQKLGSQLYAQLRNKE
jgi:hypothetical protein